MRGLLYETSDVFSINVTQLQLSSLLASQNNNSSDDVAKTVGLIGQNSADRLQFLIIMKIKIFYRII